MKTWLKNRTKAQVITVGLLLIGFIASMIFINNNYDLYDRTIVQITDVQEINREEQVDTHGNEDEHVTQHIVGEIKNGSDKGQVTAFDNEYIQSLALDYELAAGDEIFLAQDGKATGDIKRDKYFVFVAWIFLIILLAVGKSRGALSALSLLVNAVILSIALDIYIHNPSIGLSIITLVSIIIFTVLSLLMATGFNEKTYTAILTTLLGTGLSLVIAYVALHFTGEQGLRYEEMAFLTRNPQTIFMAGLLIGSLGAVMDVAITLSASMFEMYEKNNRIDLKTLKKAGYEVGKDIMGTMTNILFFAYVSGSIPMLLIYLKNAAPFGFTVSMNLSLELARALVGGIGIVLTIPIAIYISIFFIRRKQAKL
ncbi:YibE/F family protein [Oceanobacillus sp. J11TS1]|uniref:YibE/F family protein n=1 Tax=Oceanobacillus sp. J11TS1 TaxID=2807191 RepID=UPI001B0DAD39|nr:YibE/F family protein [Oceanobacillus sp. J11TS1]GIO24607.1 membrane protein [Oceanobacillus sp. J11TS1]